MDLQERPKLDDRGCQLLQTTIVLEHKPARNENREAGAGDERQQLIELGISHITGLTTGNNACQDKTIPPEVCLETSENPT